MQKQLFFSFIFYLLLLLQWYNHMHYHITHVSTSPVEQRLLDSHYCSENVTPPSELQLSFCSIFFTSLVGARDASAGFVHLGV